MADGPTIMMANEVAIHGGTTPVNALQIVKRITAEIPVPVVLMTYMNIVFNYADGGLKGFCRDAADAGVQGLIVPDVPPEENTEGYWSCTLEHGIAPIPLVSPVSSVSRLEKIAQCVEGNGFVYCVSTTGTTGARNSLPEGIPDYLKRVRQYFSQPLALGFGISGSEQVRALAGHAEIAIVGSALINTIRDASDEALQDAVGNFASRLLS